MYSCGLDSLLFKIVNMLLGIIDSKEREEQTYTEDMLSARCPGQLD